MDNIENIIFDLGGVILNIDYNLTAQAFKDSGVKNFDDLYAQSKQTDLFDLLETGKISPVTFRDELRRISKLNLGDEQIDRAWNAMLLDLPEKRLHLLQELHQKGYNLYLLSNTNQLHYEQYTRNLNEEHGIEGLEPYFDRCFFSHEIGRRKPLKSTFEWVLQAENMVPQHTVFIDDTEQHVKGANEAGINSVWLQPPKDIITLIRELNL